MYPFSTLFNRIHPSSSFLSMKNIIILGSTGSIGVNALKVVSQLNAKRGLKEKYQVVGLSGHSNIGLLKKQICDFGVKLVSVSDDRAAIDIKVWAKQKHLKLKVLKGASGLKQLAGQKNSDMVLSSVVGFAGLEPLLAALKQGKKVALANKEALVVAGDLVMREACCSGAQIIPVDSEHSAVFQCLNSELSGVRNNRSIRRIILTASGGAFYQHKGSLDKVTVSQALAHPTWQMGKKITIDCATLTNKGLEAIEAHYLFGVPMDKIHIVIHPQSIVHSLVEFEDGAVLAQLSHPDMRLPIQYALTYPERVPAQLRYLELEKIQKLEFFKPDFHRFPCLNLVLTAGRKGGLWPAVFNGANEEAVKAFLGGHILFTDISKVIQRVMNAFPREQNILAKEKKMDLQKVLKADQWARNQTYKVSVF